MKPANLKKGANYQLALPGYPTEILQYDFEQISGYAFLTTNLSKNKTVVLNYSVVKHFVTEITQ
ncbi:MAG: hypothetical protein QM800_12790 [Paludibacter sp.]